MDLLNLIAMIGTYHYIQITILNGDDLLDIYRKKYIYISLLYYNNLIYRKQSSKNVLFVYNFFINILYNYIQLTKNVSKQLIILLGKIEYFKCL
jgi:hypothetical protein